MKKITISLILFLFINTEVLPRNVWGIKDCLAYAINNAYEVKIQELNNRNLDNNHTAAILNLAPSVSAGTNARTSFGRSIDYETNTYTTTANLTNSYSLSASMTLFNGFSVINGIKTAKISQLQGKETYQQIIDNICQSTMQAFFIVIYYSELVKLGEEKVETSRLNLHNVKIQEELGLKGEADILENEAQLASDEYNLVQYRNQYDQGILTLKEKMSYPFEEELIIDTSDSWWETIPSVVSESPEEVYNIAVLFLPTLVKSRFDIETAQLNLKTSRWQQLPSLSLSGGYDTGFSKILTHTTTKTESYFDQLRHRAGQSVSASLSIPIFSRLSRRYTITRNKNNLKIYEYQYEKNLREIEKEIESVIQDVEGRSMEYILAVKRLATQDKVHTVNQKKYEEGLIGFMELQISANNLQSAQNQKLYAQFQYHIKKHLLDYYKGINYIDQEF
ncbi:MAG: TolC family protein [Rikenellaceae bacterium]|nr:TolC family protein [Rikenellaceae bacterium]